MEITDIHNKINKLVTSKFPQIKNINLTYEHQIGMWSPSTKIKCVDLNEGVLVFNVEICEETKFIPNLLSNIGNTIFLIIKMIQLDESPRVRVTFNSIIAQTCILNY